MRGEGDVGRQISGAGDGFMDRQSSNAITLSEDGVVVEAELVSGKLGLTPDAFWREIKRGVVYGVVERGEGERCRSHAADFPLSRSVLVCDVGGDSSMTIPSDDKACRRGQLARLLDA